MLFSFYNMGDMFHNFYLEFCFALTLNKNIVTGLVIHFYLAEDDKIVSIVGKLAHV